MCVRSTGREYTDSASLNVLRPLLGYTHDTQVKLVGNEYDSTVDNGCVLYRWALVSCQYNVSCHYV